MIEPNKKQRQSIICVQRKRKDTKTYKKFIFICHKSSNQFLILHFFFGIYSCFTFFIRDTITYKKFVIRKFLLYKKFIKNSNK